MAVNRASRTRLKPPLALINDMEATKESQYRDYESRSHENNSHKKMTTITQISQKRI